MEPDLRKILEALLLSTADPISLRDLVKLFNRYHEELVEVIADGGDEEDESPAAPAKIGETELRQAITSLMEAAEQEDRAYRVVEGPSGFHLATAPQYAIFVRLLRGEPRPLRLSPAAMETISIVAYRQPVTRAEIEAIRGVSADGPLNKLIELELVQVTGRAELPGRPIQYGTTDAFLEFCGIKELDELPASDVLSNHQIDDWMRKSEDPEEPIHDQDVGLAPEPNPTELPLDEPFAEIDWQKENVESDAAGDQTPPEVS
ncbi:MAG: SMC-Scp complex subunit ScpB [Coraliomargaritaceae bacterium]